MQKGLTAITGTDGFLGSVFIIQLQEKRMGYYKDVRELTKEDFFGVDTIYHFASPCSILMYKEDPIGSYQNTIEGFTNILKIAKEINATLIVPSSGSCTAPNPNLYAEGKLQIEKIADLSGYDKILIPRIFAGFGENEINKDNKYRSVVYQFMKAIVEDEPIELWGDGSQTRNFIYQKDIFKGIQKAREIGIKGVFDVGSFNLSFFELIEILQKVIGKKANLVYKEKPKSYLENTYCDHHHTMVLGIERDPQEAITEFYNMYVASQKKGCRSKEI